MTRRPDIAVLRTNPNDSSLARLLTVLVEKYQVLALVWDRRADYACPVDSPRVDVRATRRRGEYYRLSTLLTVVTLQPWFLWQLLRARPRAVNAMDLDTGVIGLVAARLLRVPFIYQCLDPYDASLPQGWPTFISRIVHRVENAVISRADLFVITDLKRLPQHHGARPRRIVELPNLPMRPVDPQPWRHDDGLVVGYIGALVPHRELDVLVDTIGALGDDGIRLVIGGFGNLADDIRRRAAQYPNVQFLGPVPYDETLLLLGRSDALVLLGDPTHPALRWVSPNKVFESMAMGRPVIVAEGTLAAERATEAGHGVTVRYGDPGDLRRSLLDLRDDRRRRIDLGAAGRRAFDTRWSPGAVTTEVLDAYRHTVGWDTS